MHFDVYFHSQLFPLPLHSKQRNVILFSATHFRIRSHSSTDTNNENRPKIFGIWLMLINIFDNRFCEVRDFLWIRHYGVRNVFLSIKNIYKGIAAFSYFQCFHASALQVLRTRFYQADKIKQKSRKQLRALFAKTVAWQSFRNAEIPRLVVRKLCWSTVSIK